MSGGRKRRRRVELSDSSVHKSGFFSILTLQPLCLTAHARGNNTQSISFVTSIVGISCEGEPVEWTAEDH